MNNKDKILNMLDILIKSVSQHSDLDEIISKARIYGLLCWQNHVSVYRQDFWETVISERILREQYNNFKYNSATKKNLHIASELYASGGHTRLLKNMLKLDSVVGDVLVTRKCNLSKIINSTNEYTLYHSNEEATIKSIVEYCLQYKNIYLHIHPDDILSAAAVKIAKEISQNKIKVIFVNHADHCFSYGFYATDLVAEISLFGLELSKHKRRLGDKSFFMGIILEKANPSDINVKSLDNRVDIISGASGYKYVPNTKNSFSAIAEAILSSIPTTYIHIIGPDYNTDEKFDILKNKYKDRFLVSPILPYDRYITEVSKADIYIDSYPITGGTAFFETRTKGLLATGILNSASGYTPFDACKFLEIGELVSAINDYALNGINSEIFRKNNDEIILENCYKCHSPLEAECRIKDALNGVHLSKPWWENNCIDLDYYEEIWLSEKKPLININQSLVKKFYLNHQIDYSFIRQILPVKSVLRLFLKRFFKDFIGLFFHRHRS